MTKSEKQKKDIKKTHDKDAPRQSKREIWSKRFSEPTSKWLTKLGVSIHFDKKLFRQDIQVSKAHLEMLLSIKVISRDDKVKLFKALDQVQKEIEEDRLPFQEEYEDIHTHIEKRVTDIAGEIGGKLHTGRSRNDLVITDTMLFLKTSLSGIRVILINFLKTILVKAEQNFENIMPGFTHMQVAQPVRLAHHLMAYFFKFHRDLGRLKFALQSLDELPLGSGAIAGVNYQSDRELMASLLGFKGITKNSMDAVSNRDWLLDFHHFASTLFIHLSTFSEEVILWASQEFAYVKLSDSVTTGSSLMPQKRNPDTAELIRGKSGRVIGNHIGMLVTLKGLPLTYNRDLQEDKEGLFDSLETLVLSLEAFNELLAKARFLPENMEKSLKKGFALATDMADYLVAKGIAFRQTHGIVGEIVRYLDQDGRNLEDAGLDELRGFCPKIEKDFFDILDYRLSTDKKRSAGSTSSESIKAQFAWAREEIRKEELRINNGK